LGSDEFKTRGRGQSAIKMTREEVEQMDVKRFTAGDSKSAFDLVRAGLGADALILSTTRTDSGVEVSALSPTSYADDDGASGIKLKEHTNEITLGYLDRELKALRKLLSDALQEMSWQDIAQKPPIISSLERRFLTLGMGKAVINSILSEVDATNSRGMNSAWSSALEVLRSKISIAEESAPELGPQIIIGGWGESRSLACKQLVSAQLVHSKPSKILVLSVAGDPSVSLKLFCKSKKVQHIQVKSFEKAKQYLSRFSRSKVVFVETPNLMPSLGPYDPVLDLFSDLTYQARAVTMLSASLQTEVLKRLTSHVKHLPTLGYVITDTSDAVSLGPILDTLFSSEMPLIGVSNQSEISLQAITPNALIEKAKRLARAQIETSKEEFVSPRLSRSA
jgi:flagellar biosynthesis protein FlhF